VTNKKPATRSIASGAALVLCTAATILYGAGYAQAQPPACDLHIKACGCSIQTSLPDVYVVDNNLSANQTHEANCIEVDAPRAILNLKGMRVIGNGTGIGILIHEDAHHAIVEGADEDSTPQAVVSQWDVGLRDDADDSVILLFRGFGGEPIVGCKVPPCHTPGNTTGGVLLRGVSHPLFGTSQASFNGKFGVMLASRVVKKKPEKNTSEGTVFDLTTESNGDTGVKLDSSPDNFIGQSTLVGNTNYGIWLLSAPDNLIIDSAVAGNQKAGILLGDGHGSDHNFVLNNQPEGNQGGGIRIDKVNRQNTISMNRANNANHPFDFFDENPHCDSNRWYNNMGKGNKDEGKKKDDCIE